MRALTPWSGMTSFKSEMDRLFDRFVEPVWREMPGLGEWEPKLDVIEEKDTITVKAELPGVDPKEINVAIQEGVLTIKGEKHAEKEENDKRRHRIERSYGAFYRSIVLPSAVDAGKATATFKDGVIAIALPKAPEAKGTMIPVKAA